MSSIVDKPFNALQRIIRSVFRGSPNLFTTADVNRQIEAIKAQLSNVEACVGVLSDMVFSGALSGDYFILTSTGTYVIAEGCDFTDLFSNPVSLPNPNSGGISGRPVFSYLVIRATKQLITYTDDASHEISGAKFADGTSQPAADTYVYASPYIDLVQDLSAVSNLVTILATVRTVPGSSVIEIRSNCITKTENLAMRITTLKSSSPSYDYGPLTVGTRLDEAILRVNSIFFTRKQGRASYYNQVDLAGPVAMKIAASNGFLHFCIGGGSFEIPYPATSVGAPAYLARYNLPTEYDGNYFATFFQKVLLRQGLTDIASDTSGEGADYSLCVMDTLAEGRFIAQTHEPAAQKVIGRVRVALAAKIRTVTLQVDSVGIYLFALREGAMVKRDEDDAYTPWDILYPNTGVTSGSPYLSAYDLSMDANIAIRIEGRETSIPMLWPAGPNSGIN